MEVINELVKFDNLKIVQNTEWFNFSLDSVLLASFVTLNKNISKILDLGSGNAPIPLILSTRTSAKIYAVELQKKIYDLACKSININNLNDKIEIFNEDLKNIGNMFEADTFDVVISNPPYFKYSINSNVNENEIKTIARHEKEVVLEDIFVSVRKVLKNNGIFALVHRTERLIDVLTLMREYNIEPKRIKFVYPNKNKNSNIMLIEGKWNGKSGLIFEEPLYVHNEDGTYTKEVEEYFKR